MHKVCLTSNVAMGAKVSSYAAHPAREFFRAGLPFAMSCDNLLISGDLENRPDPVMEVVHLVEDVFGNHDLEGWRAVRFALESAIGAAFSPSVDETRKMSFVKRVDDVFRRHGILLSSDGLTTGDS
jgi:adenosine deaminase